MGVIKLNLGCGNRLMHGDNWVNHDLWKHSSGIDQTHNLNSLPWPWANDSVIEIDSTSVFEHLEITLIQALDECWRILQKGGRLKLKFPRHDGPFTHDDPTHRWFWSPKVVDYVDPATKYGKEHPYYTKRKWRIKGKSVEGGRNVWVTMEPVK